MRLGDIVTIRVTRDYGPYADKPSLPAGEYEATVFGMDVFRKTPSVFLIGDKFGVSWSIMPEDVEVLQSK